MPLFRLSVLWRHEFRQQQHNGRQQSLGAVIEVGVITILGGVTVRADNRFGEDLGVLLRPGPRRQVGRICSRQIHVVIHQRQEVEAVRAGRVTQVDDGNPVAVVPGGDGAVIPRQVSFGVQRQKAHAAGAGVFQIGVEEKCRLAHAGGTDHQTVDVVAVHQRPDIPLLLDHLFDF